MNTSFLTSASFEGYFLFLLVAVLVIGIVARVLSSRARRNQSNGTDISGNTGSGNAGNHGHDHGHEGGSDEEATLKPAPGDFSHVHRGKSTAGGCKYDVVEERRTRSIIRPIIDLSNLAPVDARVAAVLANIQVADVTDKLKTLSGEQSVVVGGNTVTIATRNTFTKEILVAMEYLEQYYLSIGIPKDQIKRVPYTVSGRTFYNLVVTLPGRVNKDKVLVIGSHLDSTAGSTHRAEKVAPGADDDASGTSAVMETVRALKDLPLGCTVQLCHFTGEEQGLWGSYAYSDQLAKAKTNIIAMLQMDMIGYRHDPANPRVDVHDAVNRNGSHALVEHLARNVARYGLKLNVFDTHNHEVEDRSDHAGFLDHGWKAVLISEEFSDKGFNPAYHSTGDRIKIMNVPYMVEIIRMVVATAADLAEIQ